VGVYTSRVALALVLLTALPLPGLAQAPRKSPSALPAGIVPPRGVRVSTNNRVVNVTVTDSTIAVPDITTEGLNFIRMRSKGTTVKPGVLVVRIPAGTSESEAQDAVYAGTLDDGRFSSLGGPEPVSDSTGISAVQVDLRPGRYLIAAQRTGPNGKRIVRPGMAKMIVVANVSKFVVAVPPAVNSTVKLRDYDISLTKELRRGDVYLQVENSGPQAHELVVRTLLPGKKPADVWAWTANPKGPPPFTYSSGVTRLSPNKVAYMRFRVDSGSAYLLSCDLGDRHDGKSHMQQGMQKVIVGK